MGQADALLVPGDFIHPRAEAAGPGRAAGQRLQPLQQCGHALPAQRRAEIAGEHLPPGDQLRQRAGQHRAGVQIFGQCLVVAQGQRLLQGLIRLGKVHTAAVQPLQGGQQRVPPRAWQVHLVDKQKHRDLVPRQQLPQRAGVTLDAVGAADDQNGIVHHLQGALHLRGKIHVPRRVQQRYLAAGQRQDSLLGEDGNAPGALLHVGVEKRVAVVHPPALPQAAALIEHGLGQRGFACVHVGQNAHGQLVHAAALLL